MIIETAALISFATWLGTKIADKGFDKFYDKLTKDDEVNKKFYKSIEDVSAKLEKKYPDLLGNSMDYFFKQEEVFDELCKLLFVNQEVNINIISDIFHEATLPNDFILEFVSELKISLSKDRELNEFLSNKELFITIKGVSKDISELVENSSLSKKEIEEIKDILKQRFKSNFNKKNFLEVYRKNLLNNLSYINFIGLGVDPAIHKGKRKELDNIFVKPLFKLNSSYHIEVEKKSKVEISNGESLLFEKEKIIKYENLFDRPYNYVILGNPGAGKSILIKSLICNIIKKNKKSFKNNNILSFLPFRVELKNYLTYKKKNGGNLLKYLSNSLEEEFSTPSILEENLNDILRKGKIILFFDGLDEIFSLTDKIQIKNDIENFHNLYSNVRSITTSRIIGYNEARLNEKGFCELNIVEFSNEQVEEYVTKWYNLEEEDDNVREEEIKGFTSKMNSIDNELISNPLLLSLIVILYRNNLKIPESKLEIYQSCTNTLVDKWDASKNLEIEIDEHIIQKKEPILADLAFWQYQLLGSENIEINYNKVKNIISESLIKKNVADEYNSNQKAEMFLDYAQKRSIYFDNNFTHKTFLEYYTAYWIYSNIEKKHKISERNSLLRKYIPNSFWFIVLELLLNLIDKDQPDNEIIDEIINEQLKFPDSLPFLIYVIPNIKNISLAIKQKVYSTSLEYLSSFYAKLLTKQLEESSRNLLLDIFSRIQRNLIVSDHSNIIDSVIISLIDKLKNNGFYILINELEIESFQEGNVDYLLKLNEDIHYIESVKSDPYLYLLDKFNYTNPGKIEVIMDDLKEFCNLFGKDLLFKKYNSFFDEYANSTYFHYYLFFQLNPNNIKSIIPNLIDLNNIGISYIEILKQIVDSRTIMVPNKETINHLGSCYDNQEMDVKLKTLLLFILCYLTNVRNTRFRRSKMTIDDVSVSTQLKRLMKKTEKIKGLKSLLRAIVREYNINDIEVLEIIKEIG